MLNDSTVSEENRAKIQEQQDAQHEKLERIRAEWIEDTQNVRGDNTMAVLIFDQQDAFEITLLRTNVAYYKRKLWTFNLSNYNEVEKKGICIGTLSMNDGNFKYSSMKCPIIYLGSEKVELSEIILML